MAHTARQKKASWVSWPKTISFRQNSRKSRAVTWRISSGRTVSKIRRLYLRYVTNCAFCGLNVATARRAARPALLASRAEPAREAAAAGPARAAGSAAWDAAQDASGHRPSAGDRDG